MTQFVPYRKVPPSAEAKALAADLAAITCEVGVALLQQDGRRSMDVLADRGSIALRDARGKVWVLTIAPSDVDSLICEGKPAK